MTSVRLEIEYDGTAFRGWAKQPGQRTVQAELEAALETVLREPVELIVAGRTDTGVHAEGQVASFVTRGEMPVNLAQRLNGLGPRDIAVTAAMPAEDGFDARRDAVSRTYRYRILVRRSSSPFEQDRALWWPYKMDYAALESLRSVSYRHPRLHRLHPHPNRPRPLQPQDPQRRLVPRRRHHHLPHHRRRLHAQHGPHPRRHPTRGSQWPPSPGQLQATPPWSAPSRSRRNSSPPRLVPGVGLVHLSSCRERDPRLTTPAAAQRERVCARGGTIPSRTGGYSK